MTSYSMTGYGKGIAENDNYTLTVELKSVNHRFREIKFRMPSLFLSQEIPMRKLMEQHTKRGTFEFYVNYKKKHSVVGTIDMDWAKVENFINEFKEVAKKCDVDMELSPSHFIKQEFSLEQDDEQEQELYSLLGVAANKALTSLIHSREREGEKLMEVIQRSKRSYEDHYKEVIKLKDTFESDVTDRLKKRFKDFAAEMTVDEPRFLQEVVYYLEKLDIDEELDRINSHLDKLGKLLDDDCEKGRNIDFLMQELNRETNTIGSKSDTQEISEHVVKMKVYLEKIREQGLNLE